MSFYENRILPYLLEATMSGEEMVALRKATLAEVAGEVLEIGFGTGLNLPHYPAAVSRLTIVDPNEGGLRFVQRRIGAAPFEVKTQVLSGENLPMAAESFDCVVSTFTLCTIPDVTKAMGEIWRVLRANGRFHFVEHGLSNEPQVQKWQHRLTPLQKLVAGGCHLNRNMRELVTAQFAKVEMREGYWQEGGKLAGYLYQGVAQKACYRPFLLSLLLPLLTTLFTLSNLLAFSLSTA